MDLFGNDSRQNLLPRDGIVNYYGPIISADDAARFYRVLFDTIPWVHDEVVLFGKRIVTARKVAWFGDARFEYRYSGSTKKALSWTSELQALKHLVQRRSGATFNSCLLNLYHHGGEGMSWHSDDEAMLAFQSPIAALSLGAERKLNFKHKDDPTVHVSVVLESGSLLVMAGATQQHWLHSIPKTKKVETPRISLTFRTITLNERP